MKYLSATIANTTSEDASQLPANRNKGKNINYLGSSYSGADIKVLVNLYDYPSSLDNVIKSIDKERRVAEKIYFGTGNLLNGGLTRIVQALSRGYIESSDAYTKLIDKARGATNPEEEKDEVYQEARQAIFNIMVGPNLRIPSERTKVRTALSKLKLSNDNRQRELRQQIELLRRQKNQTGAFVELGTLQTVSVQSHREKFAVRALGHSHVKSYTRGPRTIAGSMVFTVFHEHAFANLLRVMGAGGNDIDRTEITSLLPDQLPPLDLTVVFANEYGQTSEFRMYGVEILNDGVTYSIEDLLTENVMQFVARDVDPLVSKGNLLFDRQKRSIEEGYRQGARDLSGSMLLNMENDYKNYLNRLRVRRRLVNR